MKASAINCEYEFDGDHDEADSTWSAQGLL